MRFHFKVKMFVWNHLFTRAVLVLQHIKENILDHHQFAFRANTSKEEDTISTALRSAITLLENDNTHVRKLFVDFCSAFSTIFSHEADQKTWVTHSLTGYWTFSKELLDWCIVTASSLKWRTMSPRVVCSAPLWFTLYTHDCRAAMADWCLCRPRSNGRRWSGPLNHVFFYIMDGQGCSRRPSWGANGTRMQDEGHVMLWATFCWESLGPAIHVAVNLTHTTYVGIPWLLWPLSAG